MIGLWILLAVVVVLVVLAGALAIGRRLSSRDRLLEETAITNLKDATAVDPQTGGVRSVQAADLLLGEQALQEIWSPAQLERLARTYWHYLTRVTLGLIRVHYTERERSVVLLFSPLKLLTFQAPEYEMDAERGVVRWRIERGLLVARAGRGGNGYLQIDIRRCPSDDSRRARLHVEVEVANFYPALASWMSRWVYNETQSRIHVIVTYGFLRSLAHLDLAESRVGRMVGVDQVPDPEPSAPNADVTPPGSSQGGGVPLTR